MLARERRNRAFKEFCKNEFPHQCLMEKQQNNNQMINLAGEQIEHNGTKWSLEHFRIVVLIPATDDALWPSLKAPGSEGI